MPILDFLTGRRNLNKIERRGVEFARNKYDPSQVGPMVNFGMKESTEGIDIESLRESLVSSTYRKNPNRNYGLSSAQGLAADMLMNQDRASAIATGEAQISLQDDQVRRQGRQTLAQALAERERLKAERDAAVSEVRMQVEAEAGRRKQALLGGVINLASAAIDPSMIRDVFSKTNPYKTAKQMNKTANFVDSAMNDEPMMFGLNNI